MTYADFLRLKGLDAADVSAEQAFRFGQASVVALLGDYLHISLTWAEWEKSFRRLFANAEEAFGKPDA